MYIVLTILCSYLLGSISPSYLIGKLRGIDLRYKGSGNLGTTNTFRNLGFKDALIIMLIDIFKGYLAVKLSEKFYGNMGMILSAIAVVLGHNFSIFLKFKGGKGMATSIGVMFAFNWQIALILFIAGLIIAKITGYMSVASITSLIITPILLKIVDKNMTREELLMWIFLSILGIIRHRDNIERLIKGSENKLSSRRD